MACTDILLVFEKCTLVSKHYFGGDQKLKQFSFFFLVYI